MNRRLLTALAPVLAFVGPLFAAEPVRVVPIVLDVVAGTAHYTTELAITNRGATAVNATLRYHPSFGSTAGGTVSRALGAGQQLVIPDVIGLLRESGVALPSGEAHIGTLEVGFAGAASEEVVAATARTTTSVGSPEGRAGLAYGALRAGSTTRLIVYGLRESEADRSNLAFLSTSGEPVTLKITVHDGSGSGASTVVREAESLAPFGWRQLGSVLREAGLTNGWAEIERVGGTGAFSAYGVVNDNVTNDGSFLPPVAAGRTGTRLTVPVIAESSSLVSELVLANRSGAPATLTLSYVRSLTAPAGGDGVATLTLGPREQRIVPDAFALLREAGVPVGPAGEGHVGTLRIRVAGASLDHVFAAARTAFRSGTGQFGLFSPAVTPAEEAGDEVTLYGLRADATNRANAAVVNSGPDSAGPVTLELLTHDGDAGGAPKGTPVWQTLAPGQHAQVNQILGAAGIANGWVRVRRVSGTAPWLAYGVVNDGGSPGERTGDGAYVAMDASAPAVQGAGDFFVRNGDVTLVGTLDLPATPGPHPVMVFVAGSGRTTRQDDRVAGSILLPQGIGLFTYDKRGVGQSTGTYQDVSLENSDRLIPERASDVAAIVNFLARHRDVDPRNIFLWGTSQGGWVVPLVSLLTENVSFVICVNGGGSSVGIEDRYSNLARDQSLSIQQLTAMLAAYTGPPGYDPKAALQALSVPALFVYGGMDRSNPTFHDIPQVESIKAERGKDFTVLLFPNMNHDLLDVTTGRFDPQLFPRIIDWARTKLRAPGGIGAAGGTVSGAGATLVIPPGALSADTVITLSRRQNAPLDSSLDAGSLVEVSPADLRFDVPATLTLPFDPTRTPAGLPLQKLGVSRLDGEAWEAAAGSAGDAATNMATGRIGRGGTYGVRRNPAAAPCVAPQHRQFDFWLGSWDFTEPSSGPGQNLITRDAAGCVIEENFVSFTYRGHSVSFYEEGTGKWYQTYVGNDGVRLVLEGTFVGGRMVLYQNPMSRYYWQTLDANRVRFALEASPNGGVTWQATPFNAIYSRR